MIEICVIEVRQDGTIWKLRNLNATPLRNPKRAETRSKRGYLMLRVNMNSEAFLMAAHRVVWTVLRSEIPVGMDINHKDGCRTNNHPDNLEVVTRSENIRHAFRVLGRKVPSAMPIAVLPRIAPRARELRQQGMSYAAIGRALGVSQTTAFRAVN